MSRIVVKFGNATLSMTPKHARKIMNEIWHQVGPEEANHAQVQQALQDVAAELAKQGV